MVILIRTIIPGLLSQKPKFPDTAFAPLCRALLAPALSRSYITSIYTECASKKSGFLGKIKIGIFAYFSCKIDSFRRPSAYILAGQ
jgi:hypothetical protein